MSLRPAATNYIYIYIYIYGEREREGEREIHKTTVLFKSIPQVAHFPASADPNITTRVLGHMLF